MILFLQSPMNYSCSCSTKIFDQGSLPKPQLLIEEVRGFDYIESSTFLFLLRFVRCSKKSTLGQISQSTFCIVQSHLHAQGVL